MDRKKRIHPLNSLQRFGVLLLAITSIGAAQPGSAGPQIEASVVNITANPNQMTISGSHFGTVIPSVTLDGIAVTILSYTDTMIAIALPSSFTPGSYALVGTNGQNHQSGSSVSTIGAVGLQGPPGPQGSQGQQGIQGSPGLPGAAGAQGPAGAAGSVAGLVWKGLWNPDPAFLYKANDAVNFNGSSYVCLAGNSGGQPDLNPQYWALLGSAGARGATGATGAPGAQGPGGPAGATGAQGAQGPVGPSGATGPQGSTGATGPAGLVWRGVWNPDPTVLYYNNDVVSFNGSSYVVILGPIGGTGQPDLNPKYWSLVSSVGARGPAGPVGSTGPQGAAGPAGTPGQTGAQGATGPQGAAEPSHIFITPSSVKTCSNAPFVCVSDPVSVPAGSYLMQANANIVNLTNWSSGVLSSLGLVTCVFVSGAGQFGDDGSILAGSTVFSSSGPFLMLDAGGLNGSTNTVVLQCSASAPIKMYYKLVLTQVGAIN